MQKIKELKNIFLYIAVIWIIFFLSFFIGKYGVIPRSYEGLVGIITAPFFHGNFFHIISNSIGLATFSLIYLTIEEDDIHTPIWFISITSGILLWLFGRNGNHIGASGLIFGLYSYLLSIGFFIKKIKYILVSIFIITFYSWMIIGLFPSFFSNVSFEAHLFGFISGIFLAFIRAYVERKESQLK